MIPFEASSHRAAAATPAQPSRRPRVLASAALALALFAGLQPGSSQAQGGAPAAGSAASPAAAPAGGAGEPAAVVRQAVEAWLKGRFKVDDVRRSPLPGIFEARIGNDLLYVDEKGQYAFVEGSMIELKTGRNLTRERVDEMLAINFKDLPLNLALKQVIGNGKRVIAVFEDPNCGYCKTLRKDLLALKDVTIYTFPVAILSPDSEAKARKALCAGDKVTAWNDLMLSGKVAGNAGTCDNNLARIRELSQKLSVSATPTVFFGNGRRLQGYLPADRFERLLEEASKS